MPNLYIISRANGSGKTTIAKQILPQFLNIYEYLNADQIAVGLSPFRPESVAIQAGKIMLQRLDYLQKSDTHAAIANAKITAQVQLPDGKKQTLPLTSDAKEKYYTAILETKATGDFKVVMLCDIGSKKVSGRFSFKR